MTVYQFQPIIVDHDIERQVIDEVRRMHFLVPFVAQDGILFVHTGHVVEHYAEVQTEFPSNRMERASLIGDYTEQYVR